MGWGSKSDPQEAQRTSVFGLYGAFDKKLVLGFQSKFSTDLEECFGKFDSVAGWALSETGYRFPVIL